MTRHATSPCRHLALLLLCMRKSGTRASALKNIPAGWWVVACVALQYANKKCTSFYSKDLFSLDVDFKASCKVCTNLSTKPLVDIWYGMVWFRGNVSNTGAVQESFHFFRGKLWAIVSDDILWQTCQTHLANKLWRTAIVWEVVIDFMPKISSYFEWATKIKVWFLLSGIESCSSCSKSNNLTIIPHWPSLTWAKWKLQWIPTIICRKTSCIKMLCPFSIDSWLSHIL